MPKLKVDGVEIEVPQGATVLCLRAAVAGKEIRASAIMSAGDRRQLPDVPGSRLSPARPSPRPAALSPPPTQEIFTTRRW